MSHGQQLGHEESEFQAIGIANNNTTAAITVVLKSMVVFVFINLLAQ
jgi:hypothetical protein